MTPCFLARVPGRLEEPCPETGTLWGLLSVLCLLRCHGASKQRCCVGSGKWGYESGP